MSTRAAITTLLHRCESAWRITARKSGGLPYFVCAALALVAIWGHRYPAGIDVAQHANLFRISMEMTSGPVEFRELYRIAPFTPYLLAYLVAYPFALLFGAIAATKCLLTLAALVTPLMMRRWLVAIGASADFGLLGFLLAFGFQYQWGFVSNELALPLTFGYLAAFERQGARPRWRAAAEAALFAVALFFCHGITFGVCILIVAVRLLLRRRPFRAWRAGLHALPAGLLALFWAHLHDQTGEKVGHDWVDFDRLMTLFSGPFTAYPNRTWALVSIAGIVLVLIAAGPRVSLQARRLVPLVVSLAAFLAVPESVAGTWMVGSRFCIFVHAFAPAALRPRRTGRLGKLWARVVLGWVIFALFTLNVRLAAYNDELAGLHELTDHMQHGLDVRTMLPETGHNSVIMGPAQLGQTAAWITAEYGGLLQNDSSGYYQIPIQRGAMPFPGHFRYIIAKGDVEDASRKVRSQVPAAHLIYRASSWLLFEDPPVRTADFTVIRHMQSWGKLRVDREVSEARLIIAGRHFDHGLGTHADSFIRLHIDKPGRAFAGACGIDDRGGPGGRGMFRIRDNDGETLFESGEVQGGEAARQFTILLAGRTELILEVRRVESTDYAHADWVDLKVTPP